jgi:hypothetical protein
MQIFIRLPQGRHLCLDADPQGTVSEVKHLIYRAEGLPAAAVRLVFAGRSLGDDQRLAECGVGREATLILVVRGVFKPEAVAERQRQTIVDTARAWAGEISRITHGSETAEAERCAQVAFESGVISISSSLLNSRLAVDFFRRRAFFCTPHQPSKTS